MIDTKELRKLVHRRAQAAISIPIKPAMLSELLDRLEAAESARRDDYQNWMTALQAGRRA